MRERSFLPLPDRDDTTKLSEEWKTFIESPVAAAMRRRPALREADRIDPKDRIPLGAPMSGPEGPTLTRIRSSLAALSRLRSSREPADWIEAATLMKRDVVRLRDTHYARHTSVLLAMADALTFTEPSDPDLDPHAGAVFDHSLALLSESFIGEPEEEAVLRELLSLGWNLAPGLDSMKD
jgi:hypothetical protein